MWICFWPYITKHKYIQIGYVYTCTCTKHLHIYNYIYLNISILEVICIYSKDISVFILIHICI